jgi:hypothetical protein
MRNNLKLYLSWAKERIEEMDAAVASLERQAKHFHDRQEGRRLIADLKYRRNQFKTLMNKGAKEGEAGWRRARGQLQSEWKKFEAEVNTHVKKTGRQFGFHQSVFQKLASTQAKSWRAATANLQLLTRKVVPARRTGLTVAVKQMKADAADAQARLKKLGAASATSWSAMRTALNTSRKAFDRANQQAIRAVGRAVK